jgi:MFS transporter, DHA1 family, tetracycline resistance protein
MRRSPLAVIFLTVFIDLVGFGIILPLNPFLARQFNATPLEIGLLLSIYSIFQFFFSPFWGALSDRIGRRPVILTSLAGGAVSYFMFAFATTLPMLFISRALAGAFAGNISAAQAYIADVSKPEDRSKSMGLIGAAFGLGFIFGPLIGALLSNFGKTLGEAPPFGLSFAALGAGLICALNLAFAFFVLPESLNHGSLQKPDRRNRFKKIWSYLRKPISGQLIFIFFLSGLAMAQMESMLFPFVADVFKWENDMASYGFAYVGVIMTLIQGYFIRKWMPKFGERKLLTAGLIMFSVSLFAVGLSTSFWPLAVAMTLLAVANGIMRPPNIGMISLLTSPSEQGAVLGVTNSLASLGRILGPMIGGWFYQQYGPASPFMSAGVVAGGAAVLALVMYRQMPDEGRRHNPEVGFTPKPGADFAVLKPMSTSPVMKIGEYQLENLIKNRVPFSYFDLRAPGVRLTQGAGHKYFTGAIGIDALDDVATVNEILRQLKTLKAKKEQPIVIICEDEKRSMRVATEVEKKYINVFVLLGGTSSLQL